MNSEFEVTLVYRASFRTARVTQRIPVSKTKRNKQKEKEKKKVGSANFFKGLDSL